MIQVNWGTPNSVLFRLSDYPGLTAGLRAAGVISAETDDQDRGQYLKNICTSLLNETLAGYSDKTAKDDLAGLVPELCRTLSDKLTERSGVSCNVRIVSLSFDDDTQKIIDDMDRMKKMSDPAYAAAELERAMKAAQEAAQKNGTPVPDPQSMRMPDLPPIPDNLDPLARAQAVTAQIEQMKKAAMGAPTAAAGAAMSVQPAPASRPKFCANCGQKLPESGNFCPNCGNRI